MFYAIDNEMSVGLNQVDFEAVQLILIYEQKKLVVVLVHYKRFFWLNPEPNLLKLWTGTGSGRFFYL